MRWKRFSILLYLSLIVIGTMFSIFPAKSFSNGNGKLVYYIPIEQEVERGLLAFMERSIETALEDGADYIVFEVNTPGGFVDAAGEISKLIQNTPVPTTAFIVGNALSAGAYISLHADQIVMTPSSEIGAAQVIDGAGNAAEEKAHSAWLAQMKGAAELNGRDPTYALAMADSSIELPEFPDRKPLTLTANEALEVGYAEAIVDNREQLLEFLGLENAQEKEMEVNLAERIARFVTHPIVIPILLSIGSMGLVLELYSPGFGVPGIMGISALLLYFFGHMVAGFAGMETLLLFVIGVVLILIEIFTAGFGLFGILGIGSIIASMVIGSYSITRVLLAILIAIILTIIMSIIVLKYVGYRGPLKRFVLLDATSTEEGYISNESRLDIVGQTGVALTPLRPAGSVLVGEERLDVVSEGGYIEQGRKIKVISSEGSKIVVREVSEGPEEEKNE